MKITGSQKSLDTVLLRKRRGRHGNRKKGEQGWGGREGEGGV
jgi:hypothetical protein